MQPTYSSNSTATSSRLEGDMTGPLKPAQKREAFEAYYLGSRRNKGIAKRPTFERLDDDTYADNPTQRHWWTWQQARAALAEKAQAEPQCVCGENTLGVVHRADGPCYWPDAAPQAASSAVPAETQQLLDDYQREVERCFDVAQFLDAQNPTLAGAFTGTPSERIKRQLASSAVRRC